MEITGDFIKFFDQMKEILLSEEINNLLLDFSKNDWLTLFFLLRKEEANMGQIADYLQSPLNTATGVVNRLVKKELIERYRKESDRRIVLLKLTPNALDLSEEYRKIVLDYIKMVNTVLTEEERKTLFTVFDKVRTALTMKKTAAVKPDQKREAIRKITIV